MEEVLKAGAAEEMTILGEVHPLLQQLGSCDGLLTCHALPSLNDGHLVHDQPSLRRFLEAYERDVMAPLELPTVLRAYGHASRNHTRELIALDTEVAAYPWPDIFKEASWRAGKGHLQQLRPLRDQRTVQRYLKAVDDGEALGWHTIVYGITLAVYSLPVRQGLLLYARQTLDGFVRSAARPLQLSTAECHDFLQSFSVTVGQKVEALVNSR